MVFASTVEEDDDEDDEDDDLLSLLLVLIVEFRFIPRLLFSRPSHEQAVRAAEFSSFSSSCTVPASFCAPGSPPLPLHARPPPSLLISLRSPPLGFPRLSNEAASS